MYIVFYIIKHIPFVLQCFSMNQEFVVVNNVHMITLLYCHPPYVPLNLCKFNSNQESLCINL